MRPTRPVVAAIDAVNDHRIGHDPYPRGGAAQISETIHKGQRLTLRRIRIHNDPHVATLFPRRHHAFATNRTNNAVMLDREHRGQAVVQLAIRDLE